MVRFFNAYSNNIFKVFFVSSFFHLPHIYCAPATFEALCSSLDMFFAFKLSEVKSASRSRSETLSRFVKSFLMENV